MQQKQRELRVKRVSPREASDLRFFSSWSVSPGTTCQSPCHAALACATSPPSHPSLPLLSHRRWKTPGFLDQVTWPDRTREKGLFHFEEKKFKSVVRLHQISVSPTKFSILASICSHWFMLESRENLSGLASDD